MPEWMKSTVGIIVFMLLWDLIRIPIQAWVSAWFTQKKLKKDFDEIDEALDDIEETNGTS